jgi:hypothetical protein
VIDWLQTTLTLLSLLLAVVAGVYVALDRVVDRWLLNGWVLLELGLLAQVVAGIVLLAGTDRDVSGITFVGYLLAVLLVPPVAVWWAIGERSRAGTAVLVAAGLVVPVLILRLDQIWG